MLVDPRRQRGRVSVALLVFVQNIYRFVERGEMLMLRSIAQPSSLTPRCASCSSGKTRQCGAGGGDNRDIENVSLNYSAVETIGSQPGHCNQ